MKKIFTIALAAITLTTFAQKDKAQYIEYENEFYQQTIKGSLNDYHKGKTTKSKRFEMDFDGKAIPKSVEEFTTIWCNTPISQGNTGTCWSFSTSSFYEAEIKRLTDKEIKLSELHTVYWEYIEKSRFYIKTRGTSSFGEGSETNAVARMMDLYGALPAEAFTGIKNDIPFHDHSGMFDEMNNFLLSLKRDNNWNEQAGLETIKSILDHYIGTPPTEFEFEGKKYTPKSFLSDVTKINHKDYVTFMSLMESPYWTQAEYDVPDNWWNSKDYNNIPLNDFMLALKEAVKNGYSAAIGGDVSESGYSPNNDVAMIPSYDIPSNYIDENARQLRFNNGSTTDDHAIHCVGYKETKDDFWFLIKDSGSGARNGKNKGYYFYHEDFVKLKTMNFTIHKDAVPDLLNNMK
jgi:bleomycin hydrolase